MDDQRRHHSRPDQLPDAREHWRRVVIGGLTLWTYAGVGHAEVMEERFDEHSVRLYTGLREGQVAFDSDAVRPARWAPHTAVYRPPGSSFRHNCQRAADIVEVRIAEHDLRRLLGDGATPTPMPQVLPGNHLQPLAAELNHLAYARQAPDALRLESAAVAFWSRALAPPPVSLISAGHRRHIDRVALARVLDQVEARLDDRLTLSELASTAGLNVHHFAKAFAATTGVTPHQHVLQRRVSRARLLLQHADMSITDVALATGFSSQSHLTSSLRRQLGVTPARYRRAMRER